MDWDDGAVLGEGQGVDAYLTVDAWGELGFAEVWVDAMVDNVPLVLAWNLQHGVMGCAIDML